MGDRAAVPTDGTEVTTDTNPHDNNEEGNGLTGTSGGAYFVDDPVYVHLQSAPLPAGTTDVRFRYSTDAAYLDTGFFVDDVTVGGQAATLSSEPGNWIVTTASRRTTGSSSCCRRATSPRAAARRGRDRRQTQGNHVYRFEGDSIHESGFVTTCLRGDKGEITAVISNLTTGDIQVLDADYVFRLLGQPGTGKSRRHRSSRSRPRAGPPGGPALGRCPGADASVITTVVEKMALDNCAL